MLFKPRTAFGGAAHGAALRGSRRLAKLKFVHMFELAAQQLDDIGAALRHAAAPLSVRPVVPMGFTGV